MSLEATPKMSVIVVTPDNYLTMRKTMKHLRSQNVSRSLELVFVAPSSDSLKLNESEMQDFFSYKIVEFGPVHSTAKARAAGVRAASAPIVALTEDHSFPAPGWAETLINRHQEDWAAVGPVMHNANPRSLTSWASFLVEYSQWLGPAEGGEREHLPGHNGTYKRDVLLEYGDRLEEMLDAESVLHWDLRARGHRLWLESAARTFHQNFSKPASIVSLRFNGGRLFASARAREWPAWRRLLFSIASPLIPLVRCFRITRELRKPGHPRHLLPRLLPALLFSLAFDGAGEMVGYALGPGRAMAKLSDLEFHRHRFMKEAVPQSKVNVRVSLNRAEGYE